MIQFENALISTLAKITELDPDQGQIRVAYTDEPGPSWKHTEDVICFYLEAVSSPYDQDCFETMTPAIPNYIRKTDTTQVINANLSLYGPHCRELANRIRVLIQKNDYREALTNIEAFPVLKTPPAQYIPYEYNKQWWQRTDMTLTFNWLTHIVEQINTFESAEIGIYKDKGDSKHADITIDSGS